MRDELGKLLNWNKARLHFIASFLIALLKVRTVNLSEIADAFPGTAKKESKYRRIQNFLAGYIFDFDDTARIIGAWLPKGRWILTLDRTHWEFGTTVINLLVLAVVCNGTAVPLLWTSLNKKGNSDTEERKQLLRRFLKLFGAPKIEYLTADREFVGEEWLDWLLRHNIPINLRIKKNTLIDDGTGQAEQAWRKFAKLPVGTKRRMRNVRVWGCTVNLEGMRLKDGDYLIVLSTQAAGIIKAYRQRWNIETMFGNLKSRGFRFEDTRLRDTSRISRLLALLALAFCYALQIGAWRINSGDSVIFKKTLNRPLKSIFRHGLDYLRELLLNPVEKLQDFMRLPKFLSCT